MNNKFDEFFYNTFELDPAGEVSKQTIDLQMTPLNFHVNLKDEFKRMRINCTYDSQKRLKGENTKGVWTGFKFIQLNGCIVSNNDMDIDNEENETVGCI